MHTTIGKSPTKLLSLFQAAIGEERNQKDTLYVHHLLRQSPVFLAHFTPSFYHHPVLQNRQKTAPLPRVKVARNRVEILARRLKSRISTFSPFGKNLLLEERRTLFPSFPFLLSLPREDEMERQRNARVHSPSLILFLIWKGAEASSPTQNREGTIHELSPLFHIFIQRRARKKAWHQSSHTRLCARIRESASQPTSLFLLLREEGTFNIDMRD